MQQKKLKEDLLKDKKYKTIMTKRDILSMPRENAVTLFRMEVGHDCLAEHLYKCHLEHCKVLKGNSLTSLYWKARGKMMQIPSVIGKQPPIGSNIRGNEQHQEV